MRRTIMAILATAIGTTLLVAAKAVGAPGAADSVALTDSEIVATSPGTSPSAVPTGPANTTNPAPASPTSPGAPTTTQANQPAPPTTQAPPAATSRTLTGNAAPASNFGNMQVRIVVTGTHIDSISTVQQSNRPGSTATKLTPLALSAQAVPTASCKTTVSGATYSCEAWKQSLQSAIGQI